jgi:tetratricopeptide (TPR) repeat protein
MSLLLSFVFGAAQIASASPGEKVALAPAEAKVADDRVDRAFALMKEGNQTAAITILDKKIADFEKAHPACSDTLVFSASNLTQTLYYSGISAALKKNGVVLDGDWALAYFLKGFALIDLKRADDALPYLDRAVALSPGDAQFIAERGEWYKSHKQWDKAFSDFKAAVDASNFSDDSTKARHKARGLRGMAYVRIEQNNLNEAERLYKESLKLEPNNAGAMSELEYIKSLRAK